MIGSGGVNRGGREVGSWVEGKIGNLSVYRLASLHRHIRVFQNHPFA